MRRLRHRRGTANTGAPEGANGAGSAVDGTPRTVRVEAIRFGSPAEEWSQDAVEHGRRVFERNQKEVDVAGLGMRSGLKRAATYWVATDPRSPQEGQTGLTVSSGLQGGCPKSPRLLTGALTRTPRRSKRLVPRNDCEEPRQ
jgi:hypothetical protein